MKTIFAVLFAIVAVTYAIPADTSKSTEVATQAKTIPTEDQIPVQVVYGDSNDEPKTLVRNKRFLLAKLLFAKAALGVGAAAALGAGAFALKTAPYWNVQKTWSATPGTYNVYKSYQPLPLPVATKTVTTNPVQPLTYTWTKAWQPIAYPSWTWTKSYAPAPVVTAAPAAPATSTSVSTSSSASTSEVVAPQAITYTYTKPVWPLITVQKGYAPVAVSTGSSVATSESAVPVAGGSVTLTSSYVPGTVTKTVTSDTAA